MEMYEHKGEMISKRDCRRRKGTTLLHGGVCHRTSTPHETGNKMKSKKKIFKSQIILCDSHLCLFHAPVMP